MKDLYRHIGLYAQVDDPNTLQASIADCRDPAIAVAARQILLNPKRKPVYDRNHRVLVTIGRLRERLALPSSDAWDALGNQDFDSQASAASASETPCSAIARLRGWSFKAAETRAPAKLSSSKFP